MPDDREQPEGVPPVTKDFGLPTPPSPGRLQPPSLPRVPAPVSQYEDADPGSGKLRHAE
jgi:hypothetical protein